MDQTYIKQADSDTATFTPEMIREYVGTAGLASLDDDDVTLGNIEVSILVIGSHQPTDAGHNPEMVMCAAGNIVQWMADYGIEITGDLITVS